MKSFGITAVAALLLNGASAHYIWNQLDIDGAAGSGADGIRPNSNYNSPVTDLASNDLRCNEGGITGTGTTVRDIKAGSDFTFHTDVAVYHQGPVSVFLSKATGAVEDYEGDGGWLKIADIGPTFGSGGATWDLSDSYTFTLPSCIPDGQYLLRIQQLGIHNPWPSGIPQFYIACAQINVSGGSGTFSPNLEIPGAFKETDSGYTANIYDPNFTSYEIPGGPVATC
ncbi:hypothetical protein N3K66_004049 [Trichothecium roseum]|uniref:Uncharacterized protein n=1 Tax=Trichothecium roseum TaxID=47278 RepID=A0ACC0V7W6_9HYPO|nr:hypothetical protein N3K66_004049 [Trichothecium roseum]